MLEHTSFASRRTHRAHISKMATRNRQAFRYFRVLEYLDNLCTAHPSHCDLRMAQICEHVAKKFLASVRHGYVDKKYREKALLTVRNGKRDLADYFDIDRYRCGKKIIRTYFQLLYITLVEYS
jgi:hypothetical protein